MKTIKRTLTEKRALAMCNDIKDSLSAGGSFNFTVEWIDSKTWGRNPRIMHRGEKVTNISGCGYCKHSACLASALSDMGGNEEECNAIGRKVGAGVSSVAAALLAAGWILECVASGKRFDAYTIKKA